MTRPVDNSPVGTELRPAFEPATPSQGVWQGEAVEFVPDAEGQIEDLAEEIGMAVAYRGDRRLLERRRLQVSGGIDEAVIERIARYRRDLPQLPGPAALQRLMDRIRALEHFADRNGEEDAEASLEDRLSGALLEYDSDVTHQYAALKMILDHFGNAVSPRLYRILQALREGYETAGRAAQVRAGFASAVPASEGADIVGADPADIRTVYRQMIVSAETGAELFRLLRRFDLSRKLEAVIAIFSKAAARDLASTKPSTDRAHIRALLMELTRLRKLKSVLILAEELVRNTARHLSPEDAVEADPVEITGDVLSFANMSNPGLEDARNLLHPYRQAPLGAQLVFANGLRDLHAELPEGIVRSPDILLRQKAALLSMLDGLVAAEEQAFAQDGGSA